MTLALNKTFLIILLIIVLFLLGISAVYGAYLLVLGQAGNLLPTAYNTNTTAIVLGLFIFSALGVFPIIVALRLLARHKKRPSA